MAEALPVEKGAAGDNAITERFCGEMLLERAPALVVRWLSEPDCTSHHTPLSLPEHKRAIATADGNVRRIAETVALSTPAAGVYYSSSALIEQSIINHPAWYRRCSRVPTDRIAKPLIVWVILSC